MGKYSYTCNGITYTCNSFKVKEYQIHYEYFFDGKFYNIYIEHYDDEISNYAVATENLKYGIALLKEKVKRDYVLGNLPTLIKDNYKIFVKHPSILKEATENVAYHITALENIGGIFKDGLIPSLNSDEEVFNASKMIDHYKNKFGIKEDFSRSNANYFHPMISNDFICYNDCYKNCALFAVNINNEDGYVASSGLGGFCMYSEDYNYNIKDIRKYARLYWKYSLTLEEFKNKEQKKTPYEYSEIIINRTFTPDELFLIGFWDNNGNFIKTDYLYNFLKDEYKNNFEDILKLY